MPPPIPTAPAPQPVIPAPNAPTLPSLLPSHAFGQADDFATVPSASAYTDPDNHALLNAINPGPAAQRREAPVEERDPVHARRARDGGAAATSIPSSGPVPLPPSLPPAGASPLPPSLPRAKNPTAPPAVGTPTRTKVPTLPPPGPHAEMRPLTPPPVPLEPSVPDAPSYPSVSPSEADPVHAAARRLRSPTGVEPPPTRIQRPDGLADRPFTPPRVLPVPEIPEPGLINAAKYSVKFVRARWQRRGAIKTLGAEIKQDTEALDQVLGALGREARNARVEGRVFSAENSAIDGAQERIDGLGKEVGDVDARKADENSKFVDVERERNTKLTEAERSVEETHHELQHFEGQRRALRDKRKELERRQKTYLKNAEDNDRQAGSAQLGDARADLRRSAEGHRKEAAALEPERQDIDRKLASLERPIGEATAKLDAAKAELDAAKRSLTDAREGHVHRLAELDAEQKRKSREIGLAEAEIQRRLVTLGTLVNLNRIENVAFAELYERIDRIRGAITARTTEIEKLTAEREAYDRGALTRGGVAIGGAIVLFIAFIVILRALL